MIGWRERKGERMSTAASPRWDEVPAVAGVGSIQKRQQSAPPYYVFSSDPLPLVPALAASQRANPVRHPCLLQPSYYAAHPLVPSHGSIAPERFIASRKISATGSSLRALRFSWRWFFSPSFFHCFLPCSLLFFTSFEENLKRTTKTKIGLLVTGGRRLNGQLAARGEFLESPWNSPVDSQLTSRSHSSLTIVHRKVNVSLDIYG